MKTIIYDVKAFPSQNNFVPLVFGYDFFVEKTFTITFKTFKTSRFYKKNVLVNFEAYTHVRIFFFKILTGNRASAQSQRKSF